MKTILSVDLGGTKVKWGLVRCGEIITHGNFDSPQSISLAFENLKNVVTEKVDGLALAFPGLVDSHQQKILSTPKGKYEDAPNIEIASLVHDLFQCPVKIENDANMFLLGEWKYGAGVGCDDFVLVTLGTGIGSSVLIEGKPLRGKHFQAGCLGGHFITFNNLKKCICGNVGCSETEASTWALKEKGYDFKTLFENESESELANHCIETFAKTLVNLIHAYDPEKIIIGGGVMSSSELLLPKFQKFVNEYAWAPWGEVKILRAQNLNSAAILGGGFLYE